MLGTTLSTIMQLFFFALIPFLVYLIKNKSVKGFWEYIGLKKSTKKANILALLAMLLFAVPILLLAYTNQAFQEMKTNPESVTGKIRQMGLGIEAVYTILVVAVIKTSLAEELFFRGFIAKRLIAITNFQIGNLLQAIIFGTVHTLLFMGITDTIFFCSYCSFFQLCSPIL